ncbi:hypothetical protein [Rhodococcus sp. EPR-157]|uniref:hypothetical protein n=1 Tax=Rhodococcus sp. EPR-157 TaxID=1813677 RepID=UPI0012E82D9A|nr:hypothetical protein [Rhodococcus sp. EPR-157]
MEPSIKPTERRSTIWRCPNAQEIRIVAACVGRHNNPAISVRATAHAGPIVDLASGAVDLAIPDIGGIVSGSAVLNSVAPPLGSADAPGTVPGFPSVPLPAAPPADSRVVGG